MTEANAALSRAKRIDEACDQFEAAWRAGANPQIDACLARVSPADQDALRSALLGVEKELKSQSAIDTSVSQSSVRSPKVLASDHTAMFAPPSEALKQIGRFEIRGVLGAGAFGKIYRGYDAHLGRDVAIKVPLAASVKNTADRDRFLKEARSAANINHPNVCQIYEVGEFENMPYIVMPVIPGQSLADAIKTRKDPLPERQVAQIVRKIASAISAAHEKGIIHRDLKPANVMFDKERKDMIVMDFGLARGAMLGDARATQSGMILGTPAYMSPEQARGTSKDVGPGADIFSLGVILYELLTGVRPFSGTATEVIGQILHVEPKPPSSQRKGIDPRLEAACQKAMSKDPTARFSSMREFVAAMDAYLRSAAPASPTSDTARAVETQNDSKDSTNDNQKLAEVFAVISAERKATAAAMEKAVSKFRTPTWVYVLFGFLLISGFATLGGIFFFIRKGTVTVIVNVPINLDDPTLTFLLDNKPVTAEAFASPVELKPGEHELVVNKNGKLYKRFRFDVGKGQTDPVVVQDVTLKGLSEVELVERLQGRWIAIEQSRGGEKLNDQELKAENKVMTIADRRFSIEYQLPNNRAQRGEEKGSITRVDSADSPAEIDMVFERGSASPVTFKGIFELDGDRLIHCYRKCTSEQADCARPVDYTTVKGEAIFHVVYERAAKDQLKPETTSRSKIPIDAVTYGGHAYKFFAENLSWKETKAKCESLGGHLIIIDSAEENALASKLIESAGRSDSWIGITDEAKEGDWRTVKGDALGYTNWFKRQNQPNNKGAGEHFGLMSNRQLANGDSINWEWSDQPNEAQPQHQPGYLCEWDSATADETASSRWIPLFNGKDLTGWDGDIAYWSVVDGVLVGKKGKGKIADYQYLIAKNPFSNFEIKVVAKLVNGNSGIQIRSSKVPNTNFDLQGPQIEITNFEGVLWGTLLVAPAGNSKIAPDPAAVKRALRPNDFNELLIRCFDKHVSVKLNGALVIDTDYAELPTDRMLGLQLHKGEGDQEIRFREISIRPL